MGIKGIMVERRKRMEQRKIEIERQNEAIREAIKAGDSFIDIAKKFEISEASVRLVAAGMVNS